jgi:hypothetical protein
MAHVLSSMGNGDDDDAVRVSRKDGTMGIVLAPTR